MVNEIVKVYYPDSSNNMQFAYCETRGSFHQFVENINSFVGRPDMLPLCFEEGLVGQRYRMYWIDEDKDKVLINSDYSLRIFLTRTNGIKKVYIEEKDHPPTCPAQEPPQSQQQQSPTSTAAPNSSDKAAVHDRVQCDNCDAIPIVGFRYKCAQCYDYDLCEKCEQKKVHPDHVMYRFPVPLPRHTDLNRRFFKKMRHGCFGRVPDSAEEGEQQRPRRCGRRRHESQIGGGRPAGPGALNQFYTMMCDLAEGMDYQDIQNAATGASAPPPPPSEAEAQAKKARQSNASNGATVEGNQSDASNAGNNNDDEDEVPLLFPGVDPIYARAGVQALKGFTEMFGKLLDPLGIVVDVDVGLKGDKKKDGEQQKNGTKPSTPEREQPSQEAASTQNNPGTSADAQQPETSASGTQTPNIIDLDSPASTSASIAPISVDSIQSISVAVAASSATDGIRVFASDASQQTGSNQENEMEIDTDAAAAAKPSTDDTNKKRGSTPIEASWTMIEKQFVDLHVDGQPEVDNQPTTTDSQQQTSQSQSVNYSQLSKDLLSHIQAEERAKQQQEEQQKRSDPKPVASVVHHPDKKINNSIIAMTAMGFSNEGGWLTNLLETVNGDIPRALELLHPSR